MDFLEIILVHHFGSEVHFIYEYLKFYYLRRIGCLTGGVFVVLLCGLALAILVAILEFCWNSKKNAQTDRVRKKLASALMSTAGLKFKMDLVLRFQQSLCSEMAEELRFAIRCHGSRQRPALKRSCTRCSPGTTYVPAALEIQHINGVNTIRG